MTVEITINDDDIALVGELTQQTVTHLLEKRAKAFWFFSYLANGMNLKDIALLTYDDLNGNEISFERAKTRTEQSTAKDEIKVVLPSKS